MEPLGDPTLSPFVSLFNELGTTYDAEPCLLAAIAKKESVWRPLAVSFDGNYGRGLMQIDAAFHAFAEQGIVYKDPIEWVVGAGRRGKAVDVPASVSDGAPVFDARKNLDYACSAIIVPAFKHYAARPDCQICVIASYNSGVAGLDACLKAGKSPESATFDPKYVPEVMASYSWLTAASVRNEGNVA